MKFNSFLVWRAFSVINMGKEGFRECQEIPPSGALSEVDATDDVFQASLGVITATAAAEENGRDVKRGGEAFRVC